MCLKAVFCFQSCNWRVYLKHFKCFWFCIPVICVHLNVASRAKNFGRHQPCLNGRKQSETWSEKKNVSYKHVKRKILIRSSAFGKEYYSERDEWFMSITIPISVHLYTSSDLVLDLLHCMSSVGATCSAETDSVKREGSKMGSLNTQWMLILLMLKNFKRHYVRGEGNKMPKAQIVYEPRTCRQRLFTTPVEVQLLHLLLFLESWTNYTHGQVIYSN